MKNNLYLISFYVPVADAETVKEALFAAGAGQVGEYAGCAWQTLGQGQFFPLAGSQPTIGKVNEYSRVLEYKVELVCEEKKLKPVVQILLKTHPYETPAYAIQKIMTLEDID